MEYELKRAREIVKDWKYQKHLIYLIGKNNGIDKVQIERDYKENYFIAMIAEYLKS